MHETLNSSEFRQPCKSLPRQYLVLYNPQMPLPANLSRIAVQRVALGHSMESGSDGTVRFGPFELDTRAGHLRKGKAWLRLQPQPFKLLSLLVHRAGQLVTREEIQQQLWDEDTFVDFEQGLNVCIRQIRTALNDTPASSRFVETVPRRGYRFIASATNVARHAPVNSLAALPFENSSGDPDLEYLCQGIAESLINTLSDLQQLRVIARQTAFRLKTTTDLAKVACELKVRAAVSGRVISAR